MKNVIALGFLLFLLIAIGFLSCASGPETDGNLIYGIENSGTMEVPLYDNPPWNFQCLIPLREGVQLVSGDIVTLDITATSDLNIGMLKVYLVDQGESGPDWNVISEFYNAKSGVLKDEEFSFSYTIPVTADAVSDYISLGIIAEYDVVRKMPTLFISDLRVSKNSHNAEDP